MHTCAANSLASCSITLDDRVVFSNFNFTATSNYTPSANDIFTLTDDGLAGGTVNLTFNSGAGLLPPFSSQQGGTFTYTVTLLPNGPGSTNTFDAAEVDYQGQLGIGSLSTVLSASGLNPSPYRTSSANPPGPIPGTFSPNLTSRTFTQDFSVTRAASGTTRLNSVTSSWTAKKIVVPGPIPLLGAATAFGLSRKLRSRIRSAA